MGAVANEYIIITTDGRIIGCENKDGVKTYLDEQLLDKIREYCDNEGLDYEQLSSRRRREIRMEIEYTDGRDKVIRTKLLIKAINNSELDDDSKSELVEIFEDEFSEFFIEDFDGLCDIIDELVKEED